jgi:hypothetical protein
MDDRDQRSEFESATAMTEQLTRLGLTAETVPTGGNCYSSSIKLDERTSLDLNDMTGAWGWGIYHEGGHVMSGYWDGAKTDEEVAAKTKALIDAMGVIIR